VLAVPEPQTIGNPSGMSRTEIIRWWEQRRVRYNLIVGCTGMISVFLVTIIGAVVVKPGEDFVEPTALFFGPVVYAIAANVCYTAGWLFDITFYDSSARQRLFKTGLIFSVVLTSIPGIWSVIALLITVYRGHELD
jgi:hypothetical protein